MLVFLDIEYVIFPCSGNAAAKQLCKRDIAQWKTFLSKRLSSFSMVTIYMRMEWKALTGLIINMPDRHTASGRNTGHITRNASKATRAPPGGSRSRLTQHQGENRMLLHCAAQAQGISRARKGEEMQAISGGSARDRVASGSRRVMRGRAVRSRHEPSREQRQRARGPQTESREDKEIERRTTQFRSPGGGVSADGSAGSLSRRRTPLSNPCVIHFNASTVVGIGCTKSVRARAAVGSGAHPPSATWRRVGASGPGPGHRADPSRQRRAPDQTTVTDSPIPRSAFTVSPSPSLGRYWLPFLSFGS